MRLIDADKFYDELKERSDAALKWYKEETDEENKTKAGASVITFCEVKLTLDNQPTVDAVPVVRCKDCKWLYVYIEAGEVRKQCAYRNYCFGLWNELNGFCEKGQRKDG